MRNSWRYLTARAIEVAIGLVLLIAGGLKAWEPLDFIRQIGDYQIITAPGLIKLTAWVMIIFEIALGTALIVGYRRRLAVPVAALLLLGFLVMLGWAWHTGSTEDCGCFGSWVKRTPAEAFTEDLVMLIVVGFGWSLHRHEERHRSSWRPVIVVLAVLAGLSVTILASNSARQSTDPLQRMKATTGQPNLFAGVEVSDLPLRLDAGPRVVVLLDTGCEHCQASVPELNRLYAELQSRDIPLVALCTNTPAEIAAFTSRFKAGFPLGRISSSNFTKLFERGRPPRLLVARDGELLKIWDGMVPPVAALEPLFK
jgi:uncharacterized membrane protein YphA (DoxX/SURF4 family)